MDSTNTDGSALGRMFNILAAPGEVFADLKERPVQHTNWVVPGIVALLCGVLGIFLLFSQDWAMREMGKAASVGMEQQIREGKMTQAQADQGAQFMEKYGHLIYKIAGSIFTFIYAFGLPFFWGFIIWLAGVKIGNADFEYMKAVEAAGLATIVYTLAGLLGVLVSFAVGHLTSLSPAFFLQEFDWTSKKHFTIAALNPFYIWYVVLVTSAVATLSGMSWTKAAVLPFAVWIGARVILIGLGMGQYTM